MNNIESKLCEILEVEKINDADFLNSFESWDSLTILSIIAYAMDEHKKKLTAQEIEDSSTIDGLIKLILA